MDVQRKRHHGVGRDPDPGGLPGCPRAHDHGAASAVCWHSRHSRVPNAL